MIVEKLVISASFSAGLESNEQGSQRLGIGNTCVYTVFICKQLEDAFSLAIKHTRLRLKTVRAVITP